VLRRDQIDHVMSLLIVLLRARAESATNQDLHRLIRKVNELSGEGRVEDQARDQPPISRGAEHVRWRAVLQGQARDELAALVSHMPHMFSSLPTLMRLVPQFSHVTVSRAEISAAHVQHLCRDTLQAPRRTLGLLREVKRALSDDQLLHVAPHVIGTLLPILVRADDAQFHHVISTFVSVWRRVHRLDPEHVMQWTTRALLDDAPLLTDPLRLFEILPNMVVHPHLFSALFLEVRTEDFQIW
jgi:hypothetical protein